MLNEQMYASTMQRLILALVLLLLPAAPGGCNAKRPARANIQSADAAERILAIKKAADTGDTAAIPLIVDRLEDEDQAVQFFAILALERLTGKRFGYEVGQSSSERVAAIDRWRSYVEHDDQKVSINREKAAYTGDTLSQSTPVKDADTAGSGPSTGN
jgi:hypothetical protein